MERDCSLWVNSSNGFPAVANAMLSMQPRDMVFGVFSAWKRRWVLYKMYSMTDSREPWEMLMVSSLGSDLKSPSWKVVVRLLKTMSVSLIRAGKKIPFKSVCHSQTGLTVENSALTSTNKAPTTSPLAHWCLCRIRRLKGASVVVES